jgi:methionine-rich copper-binding protein CopC
MDNSINDILGANSTQLVLNPVNDSLNADLFKASPALSLSQQLSINRFEQSLIKAPLAASQSITDRGIFTVDQTGKLTIDFLADSGSYHSEMAIFSLRGMDGFTLGSSEFIKEAASRALSSSSLGYVVISDFNEGARFIGELGESDKNDDRYTGVKTFDFTPDDRVAMMLVPEGTIREVLNSALLDGNKLPLFSITGANPGKATQLGQILPNVFGWEDLRIDRGGDADYNDIVFQVKGAVTTQIDLGKLAAPGKDWQYLPFAQQIFNAVFEDKNLPSLNVGLSEDTGANKLDRVTSNPVITGTVTDDSAIRRLRAGFGDTSKTIDVSSLLQDDGSFTLDRQELATIQGSELVDGDYKLILEAEDKFGKISKSIIDLVLDTKAAIAPSEIKIKNNLGIITNQKTPTLTGKAETGTTIQIFEGATKLGETIAANGLWELATTQLTDGAKSLTVQSIDLAGNNSSSTFALTVDTVFPTFSLATANAQLNLGAKLQGSIDGNGSAIDRVSYHFGNSAEVVVPVNDQGQFDVAFDFGRLSGTQNLVLTAVDVAGNVTTTTSVVTINTDNTLPRAVLTSQASTAANYLELAFDKPVTDESFAADKYSLKLTDGAQAGRDISIGSIQKLSSTQVRVNLANPLAIGNYRLALAAGVTDTVGNITTAAQEFDLRSAAPAVTISPADGEERISLSRDTVIRFGKKIDPTTVNSDSFYLIANGERVAGRLKVSSTEEFATFFYDAPLPAATLIRVVVDGNKIIGRDGLAVDGDGNGTPGGMATGDFSTLPITPIPGTEVWGYVYDSYNKNPDGSNIPLKNVTIRLDSLPDVTATTDAQGYFILKNLPASDFFVYIDGAKAAGLPTVSQYAGLGKALHSVPGQSTQLFANGQIFNIYLPPLAASDIQTLSTTTDTNVGFGAAAQAFLQQRFPTVDADLWKQVQVTFKANSAQDDAGTAATQAVIIPVDPSRLPSPLPAGANPKLVISIQAGGANGFNREAQGGSTSFDVPAPLQFPNLDGLKPGDKSLFWSFDHDAGKWVIIGTGTVSLDGKMIVSDPGVGVLAPGWHFTQPGNCGGSGGPPQSPPAPSPNEKVTEHNPESIGFVTGENNIHFERSWTAPPNNSNVPVLPPLPGCVVPPHTPNQQQQPFTNVNIEIDGPLKDFMKSIAGSEPLISNAFTLSPGTGLTKKFGFDSKSYDEIFGVGGFKNLTRDQLYGSQIKITVIDQKSNGERTRDIYTYYIDRWIDVIDAEQAKNKAGDTAVFHRTLADGIGGFLRSKNVDFHLPLNVSTKFKRSFFDSISSSASPFSLGNALSGSGTTTWTFDPAVVSSKTIPFVTDDNIDNFDIQVNDPKKNDLFVGKILLKGTATNATQIDINQNGYKSELKKVLQSLVRLPGSDLKLMTVDDEFQYTFLGNSTRKASNQFSKAFAGFLPGDTFTNDQLDVKLDQEANSLLAAVQSSYTPAGKGYEIGNFTASDLTVTWQDSFIDPTNNNINVLGIGTPINGFAIFDADRAFLQNHIAKAIDISDAAKQWALAEGLNKNVKNTGSFSVGINISWASTISFAEFVASTVSHEIGHTFGLNEAYKFVPGGYGQNVPPSDILGAKGPSSTAIKFASQNVDLLRAAIGSQQDSDTPLTDALKLYQDNFNLPISVTGIDVTVGADQEFPELGVKILERDFLPGETFVTPSLAADGEGGEVKNFDLALTNTGLSPLKIESISLNGKNNGFSLKNANITGSILGIGLSEILTVQFDPTTIGIKDDTLTVNTNAGATSVFKINLKGQGISPLPVTSLKLLKSNNFGGVKVDDGLAIATQLVQVTNDGKELLNISNIQIVEGSEAFTFLDLPTDLATNPIKLNFGESFSFGNIQFDPNKVGSARGIIEITTNDPSNPSQRFSVVGTGLDKVVYPQWGNDFITIELPNLPNSPTIRVQTDAKGNFQTVLPPEQYYHLVAFDPVTSLVSHSYGYTSKSGQGIDLTASLVFNASTAADTDSDGLPDDIEFAVGTAANKADTDGDGISDFAEIQQGIDPLGGRGFPTGIIASLPLKGEAKAVVVEGSITNPQNQTAYVATGSYGLAVINASKFNSPIVLGQLDLLGDATDIAVDSKRNIAAVAANNGGLHLINIADGMLPILNQTIQLAANQVEIADGIAYATVNNTLHVIDLSSGQELQILTLPGFGRVTGLAREGTRIYAYVSGSDTFSIIDIAEEGAAKLLGQLNVNIASTDVGVSAGNGVAYLAGSGLSTIDVSDPLNPKLISGADTFFTSRNVALNGSGLALVSAENQGVGVYNIDDLQKTDNVLVTVDTPGFTYGTAIASGIAFVADGTSGLQVINYLPFDNKGKSPTVKINSSNIDLDPARAGIQVLEGSNIPLSVDIHDDVQVRNVELLVDGQVITNDVSFPWDLSVIAPLINPNKNTFDIQVRTTDTGGNTAISNRLTLDLLADRFAPTVLSFTPLAGSRSRSNPTITVKFNEAVDSTKLNATGITLTNFGVDGILGNNDDIIIPLSSIQTRNFDKTLVLQPNGELATGNYQLRIDPSIIADRAGNTLVNPLVFEFTKLDTVNINTSTIDLDPITPGIQVLEGSDIPLLVDIRKDLQVRNIELVINGQVVSRNDLFIPNLSAIAPAITLGKSTVAIQVRTTDINGAVATSNQLTLSLLADRSAPIVLETSPIEGTSSRIIPTITVRFNEAIDSTKLSSNGFTLTNLGTDIILGNSDDVIVPISSFQIQDSNKTLVINTDGELAAGIYQLRIDPSIISDRVGNSPANPIVLNFTKRSFGNIPIFLGTPVTGRLIQPGDDELYSFQGSTGQYISLQQTLASTSEEVFAEVISPSGKQLETYLFGGKNDLLLLLNETGQYLINIKSSNNLSSDFGFLLEEKSFSAS